MLARCCPTCRGGLHNGHAEGLCERGVEEDVAPHEEVSDLRGVGRWGGMVGWAGVCMGAWVGLGGRVDGVE